MVWRKQTKIILISLWFFMSLLEFYLSLVMLMKLWKRENETNTKNNNNNNKERRTLDWFHCIRWSVKKVNHFSLYLFKTLSENENNIEKRLQLIKTLNDVKLLVKMNFLDRHKEKKWITAHTCNHTISDSKIKKLEKTRLI